MSTDESSVPKEGSRFPAITAAFTIILTLGHWTLLLLDNRLLESLPYWYWERSFTPLPMWWIFAPLATLAGFIVHHVIKRPERTWLNLLLLILLGYCIQLSFAHMTGLGMYSLTGRMTQTDHGMFAKVAAQRADMTYVLRNYYELIQSGELSSHPHSTKPPGQLLFYMATERVSRRLMPGNGPAFQRLSLFAAIAWPLLTYVALIPLHFISRLFLRKEYAFLPPVLYVFVPNVTLMTLHLDQCLYPLLFLVPVCLFVLGLSKRSICLPFIAGLAACVGLFVSFSLVPLLALPLIYTLLLSARVPSPSPRPSLISLPLYFLGLASGYVFLRLFAGYSGIEGYLLAMTIHHGAKIADWTCGRIACVGLVDIVEFAVWTGMPLFVLFLVDQAGCFAKLRRQSIAPRNAMSLSTLTVMLLMAFAGRTVAETGRLWIFVVPLVCLSAGSALQTTVPAKRVNTVTAVTLGLQLVTILLIKAFHDFY